MASWPTTRDGRSMSCWTTSTRTNPNRIAGCGVTLVHFHFTPTYSSWLNQVECWFSILSRQALQGASFTSPRQLRQAIDDFVAVYNKKAAPFEWSKAVVFQSAPQSKYSNLRK